MFNCLCNYYFIGGDLVNSGYKPISRCISVLYRHAQIYVGNQLKPYNLGRGQYTYLLILYKNDGISQEELSKILMIDKGTTARAIEKLESIGYVKREVNPEDKRAYNVFLTDKAKDLEPVLYSIMCSWNNILLNGLEEEEKDKVDYILEKMVTNTRSFLKNSSRRDAKDE